MNATPAMTAAVGQCENEPKDCPMGSMERASERIVSPAMSSSAPMTSVARTA